MEALVERLEQAVIRLEAVAVKLQNCPEGLVNGDISSIINGGTISTSDPDSSSELFNIVIVFIYKMLLWSVLMSPQGFVCTDYLKEKTFRGFFSSWENILIGTEWH